MYISHVRQLRTNKQIVTKSNQDKLSPITRLANKLAESYLKHFDVTNSRNLARLPWSTKGIQLITDEISVVFNAATQQTFTQKNTSRTSRDKPWFGINCKRVNFKPITELNCTIMQIKKAYSKHMLNISSKTYKSDDRIS